MDWNFTMSNYDAVWGFMVQLGILLIFLMLGNILRRRVPVFRKCLIPSALLGGTLLLIANRIFKHYGITFVDKQLMQVITYHCLAIGFAAMSPKIKKSKHQTNPTQVIEFGALQGGTYMLQAFVGLGITILMFFCTRYNEQVTSYISGLILPLAFGQGPGNALNWDINFTNTDAAQFFGNGSFGLSLASIGFVVASIVGVFYINIQKKRNNLIIRDAKTNVEFINQINPEGKDIPDSESIDKFSVQVGFVALAYAISFGFMYFLGNISDFTNNIAWGFNFLWASLAAMLIKIILKKLQNKKVIYRDYINNYQMDRISGFAFDLMIIAGVTAIEIEDIKDYIIPIIILSAVGTVITFVYIRKVSKECFKGFEHEFFLMSFGTLTGTASNGMILTKEIDPGLKTPTSSLYILSNFPAMVMIAPLLLLLNFAASSFTNAIISCGIFFLLWLAYTIYLFRRRIFKKRFKDKPMVEWKDRE